MNGPIAQAVALACHANAALRGSTPWTFWPSNSTAQFCATIDFVQLYPPWDAPEEYPRAADPEAWFAWLRANGFTRAGVRHDADRAGRKDWRTAGAIGGGGAWSITTVHRTDAQMRWLSRWRSDAAAPREKRWHVRYALGARDTVQPAATTVARAHTELCAAIDDAHALTSSGALAKFRVPLDNARSTLTARSTRHGYHRDLAPPGVLSDEASALLDACQSAWVFGGMGSWNDDDSGEACYVSASERLFAAISSAIVVATNSDPEHP